MGELRRGHCVSIATPTNQRWGRIKCGPAMAGPAGPSETPLSEVHPGQNKRVRVVAVRSARGIYKRPVARIALLLHPDDQEHSTSRTGFFRRYVGVKEWL